MTIYGSYNENTGNKEHGGFYCQKCGEQVPIGFQHYHADELLKKIREDEKTLKQLSEKTFAVQHNPNCTNPYLVRLTGESMGIIDLKPSNLTADILGYGKTLDEAVAMVLEIQERQKNKTPAFTDACE